MVLLPKVSPRFKIKQSHNSISTASHTKGILQQHNKSSHHHELQVTLKLVEGESKICMTVDFAANLGCVASEYSHGHFPGCVIGGIQH